MSFLKKLAAAFSGGPRPVGQGQYYYVRCRRCGEVIQARLNMANEASAEYDENGNPSGYIYRKVLIGRGRCFQSIEVTMRLDTQRQVLSREIKGGDFVDKEEYDKYSQANTPHP